MWNQIETCELVPRLTRQERNRRVPDVTQRIVVTQNSDDEICVKGDPLTIPFYRFFLRDTGADVGDIFLDENDLKIMSTSVWAVHSNIWITGYVPDGAKALQCAIW